MSADPAFRPGELEAAVHLVRVIFGCASAENISNTVAMNTVRLLFDRRFPHLGEAHLIEAMRGALVTH